MLKLFNNQGYNVIFTLFYLPLPNPSPLGEGLSWCIFLSPLLPWEKGQGDEVIYL